MSASRFIEEFRSLSTSSSRRDALDVLAAELNPYEWKHLAHSLSRRTFQCDIIASLPSELVTLIFKYLDFTALFKYTVVCRRWQEILGDTSLRNIILSRHFTKNDPPLTQHPSMTVAQLCNRTGQHLQAYRKLRPFQTPTFHAAFNRFHFEFDFSLATFSWVESSDQPGVHDVVHTFNFTTGKKSYFSGDGKESIMCVAQADNMVSFISIYGTCYAVDLSTMEKQSVRLPSARIYAFTCRNSSIGAVIGDPRDAAKVLIWNCATGFARDYDIDPIRSYHQQTEVSKVSTKLLLAESGDSFVVFHRIGFFEKGRLYTSACYSIAGDKLSQQKVEFQTDDPWNDRETIRSSLTTHRLQPCNNEGDYVVDHYDEFPESERRVVMYNENTHTLTLRTFDLRVCLSCFGFSRPKVSRWSPWALWKDQFIFQHTDIAGVAELFSLHDRLDCEPHSSSAPLTVEKGRNELDTTRRRIYCNETFVISVYAQKENLGFTVRSFDPGLDMPLPQTFRTAPN